MSRIKKYQAKIFRVYVKFFLRSSLNIKLGRIFFGNDSGIYSNLIGEYILKRDRKKVAKNGYKKSQRISSSNHPLKLDGFLLDTSMVGSTVIEKISQQWDEYCKDKPIPEDGRFQLSSKEDKQLILKHFPNMGSCINEAVQGIIEDYYQCHMNILNYHIYRIYGNEDDSNQLLYGSTATWHNDGSTAESLKLFFMLSDIKDSRDGPTRVLDIDQTRQVIKSGRFHFPDKESTTAKHIHSKFKPQSMVGKKGTAFIVRTNQCLHSASVPEEGRTRDLLVFYITSSSKQRTIKEQIGNANFEQILGLNRLKLQ